MPLLSVNKVKPLSVAIAALVSLNSFVYASELTIVRQALQPGGFVLGTLTDCESYTLNSKTGRCDDKGQFIFGFGRDAKLQQQVEFKLKNGQALLYNFPLAARTYKEDKITGVASKYVAPPDSVIKRIASDNKQIGAARKVDSDLNGYQQTFIWPSKGRISGVYGSRRIFNNVPKRPHFGLDVAAPTGTEVVAPAAGIIRLAHNDMYYSGGTIILDHGYGLTSTFIHLSKLDVKEGQVVKQGDKIAEIGATGRVTGAHLDWRINWFSERLDPAFWVKPGGNKK
ncbi:M23 family metallopeptidase [Saccharobesus litoralis]|uniref:M23 family metallopeptidase n=1 Tax=Saccharobesus litoralis TaxID=2172099 RepID=UPI001E638669|nr:M23 family metallopeptidase [Saccharobesus litoralis]